MHFTFIALTPVIDVDFLSYHYKFFCMQMACWWKSSADGTGRGKDSPCRPSTANPWELQIFWGTVLRACRIWTRPFVQEPCRRSKTSARSSSLALFCLGRQAGREHITAFETCTAHAGWQALELPFILIPPHKPYLSFQQQFTPGMFIAKQHNGLKLEAEKLPHALFIQGQTFNCKPASSHTRTKCHTISQDQTSANLDNTSESWISFHPTLTQILSFCTPGRKKPSAWVCTGLQCPLLKFSPKVWGPENLSHPVISHQLFGPDTSSGGSQLGCSSRAGLLGLFQSFLLRVFSCLAWDGFLVLTHLLLEQLITIGHILLFFILVVSFAFPNKYSTSTFHGGISCLCYIQHFGKTS